MTEINIPNKGQVKIYACGGCAANISQNHLAKFVGVNENCFADLSIVYIDTSVSNFKSGIKPEDCYIFEGLDGSGSHRAENYDEISSHIKEILQQHKPVDLNIVISSASGGSGSPTAGSITSELLQRGESVIVVAIGSIDTVKYAENTIKTLKSYEHISKLAKRPIVMQYYENSATVSELEVNNNVTALVTSLCALYSRRNYGLDSADLKNWLNFDKVTAYPPKLASLTMLSQDTIPLACNVIGIASLATMQDEARLPFTPDYRCLGKVAEDAPAVVQEKLPQHFVIYDGVFEDVANHLNSIIKQLEETRNARVVKHTSLLEAHDKPTDTGIIL